ncbi:hypothetical protein B5V03_05120 [Bradyrhizobium betae]|uniref:Uncharacterized protein n=1 Tax=Bradyrhizobium betae TaxID=244734 RepID=A0A4Q1VH16_9BRAD|nr:hypothetical protein B5V03_05120 [Bradyrhizobium betae]
MTSGGALPLPLAGEGWGGGLSAGRESPRGENPHPPLRGDLSRKRERLRDRGPINQFNNNRL